MSKSLQQYHPLQRLASPSRGISALVHATSLVSFALSFRYLLITPNPINDSYGWHLQYLTIIGLSLSTVTFAFGLLADITLSPALFSIKNALSIASAPLEILISLLYWSLRAIDPKLVVPEFAPPLAPIADIGFHLVPSIVMLIDILFLSPPWTIATVPAIGLSSIIAIVYWFWVEECAKHNGFYPYPLFDEVGHNGRVALFIMSAVIMTTGTWSLKKVFGRLNGREVPGRVKKE
ncbi:hypothetical protein BT63DRAFT_455491 [Microthyrium microscopicum]|uniref:Integral membrane protein n=1 Tax=Microthyrium microscopicum TaxID=703497 RepID=A0A6A6UB72_9PEZI|nr:hypothetical protein BT63DRAFT_455491 [Microthyrium microscopicum]